MLIVSILCNAHNDLDDGNLLALLDGRGDFSEDDLLMTATEILLALHLLHS